MHKLLDEIYCEVLEQDWINGKADELHFVSSSAAFHYIQSLDVGCNALQYSSCPIDRLFGINIEIYNDCNGLKLVDKNGSIVAAWHWLALEQRLQSHSEVK